MPEGHTIHRIARDHGRLLAGRTVAVSSPQGRFAAAAELVDGHVLERIEPYGKHLFYWWDNDLVGHVHLGLFGKFRVQHGWEPVEPIGEVRMRLRTDEVTIDLAGPNVCTIGTAAERDAVVARLGPDPLRRDAKPQLAIDRMARSKQPLGSLLLDQSVMCGVGNVYRAEALFVNGIRPTRPGREASPEELDAIWRTVVTMLKQGVKEDRIATVDRRELRIPKGRLRRGEATYVYHRDRCLRCDTPIEIVELAGRACYFCPHCQPA